MLYLNITQLTLTILPVSFPTYHPQVRSRQSSSRSHKTRTTWRLSCVKLTDASSIWSSYLQTQWWYDFRICSSPEILNDSEIKTLLQRAIKYKKIHGVTVSIRLLSIKLRGMARPFCIPCMVLQTHFSFHQQKIPGVWLWIMSAT